MSIPRLSRIFIILGLIAALLGGSIVQPTRGSQTSYIDPALLTQPDDSLPVIVTAASPDMAARAILSVGGQVKSRLWLIQAVSATIPRAALMELATTAGIRSIVSDRQTVTTADCNEAGCDNWPGGKPDQLRRLAQASLDSPLQVPPVGLPDGGFFSITESGKFLFLNPNGSERLRGSLGVNGFKNPLVTSPDGTVYAASENNKIFAIYPSGQVGWSYAAPNRFYNSPAIAPDGSIIAIDEKQVVYALDPLTGRPRWTLNLSMVTPGQVTQSPAVAPDGTIYFINGRDPGILFAVSPIGKLLWTFTGNKSKRFDFGPVLAEGRIYLASAASVVYAVSPDGKSVFTAPTANSIIGCSHCGRAGQLVCEPRACSGSSGQHGEYTLHRQYWIDAPENCTSPLAGWINHLSDD